MRELAELACRFMLHSPRYGTNEDSHDGAIAAAVLLILTPSVTGEWIDLLLIRRPWWLRHHPGQLSFPGGKRDPQDDSLLATAIRETREELGLMLPEQRILGALPGQLTVTGFHITPFLTILESLPALSIARDEVAEVLRLPWNDFAAAGAYRPIEFRRNGLQQSTPAYWVQEQLIWGATARMISDLLKHLQTD